MIVSDALFRNGHLSDYLRKQVGAVDNHVRTHVLKADLALNDDEIVKKLMTDALVTPLVIDFDSPERQIEDARVEVADMFSGRATIDGVKATKGFRFTGQRDLFELQPSSWSNPPHASVSTGRVTITYRGRKDPDGIKAAFEREETALREYSDNSRRDVEAHNAQLPALLKEAVGRRRRSLEELDRIKDF